MRDTLWFTDDEIKLAEALLGVDCVRCDTSGGLARYTSDECTPEFPCRIHQAVQILLRRTRTVGVTVIIP